MEKVSIITMHRIYNYGSILQTYATQKIFERRGYKCEVVDYISPYRATIPLFLEYPLRLEGKRIKKALYYIAKIPSFALKNMTFGGFIKKHINLSSTQYITNGDLKKNPPDADIYVTGSDQVWNSKYNHGVDTSYYLDYAKPKAKKFAFVSSFGCDNLSSEEAAIVKPLLKRYDAISVREDSAFDILKEMEIDSTVLIDPTLQLRKEEWLELSSNRLVLGKYLLLFLLYNEDNGATDYSFRIAKHKNLKIVKLSWELKKPYGVDRLFTHRRPQDFLSLFANADYIVTNSFHGVAFSINMNRNFSFVPRSEFNGRIDSLLRLTNLEGRKVKNFDSIEEADKNIDYSRVNTLLDTERKKANDYLNDVLIG